MTSMTSTDCFVSTPASLSIRYDRGSLLSTSLLGALEYRILLFFGMTCKLKSFLHAPDRYKGYCYDRLKIVTCGIANLADFQLLHFVVIVVVGVVIIFCM